MAAPVEPAVPLDLDTYLTDQCRYCEAEWDSDSRKECTCVVKLK